VLTRGHAHRQAELQAEATSEERVLPVEAGTQPRPSCESGGIGTGPPADWPRHTLPQTSPPQDDGVGWTHDEIQQLQQQDKDIGFLCKWLLAGRRPSLEELNLVSPDLKSYWMQWDSLLLIDGVVYRSFHQVYGTNKYMQLLVPRSIRQKFLEMVHVHTTGHFARRKTLDQIQRRAYWPARKTDTKL